ncbi:MAG: hypothetical protein IJ827_06740 [Lachnospiraceae bacterium]|nr:hypothetical protein [Lachnospiraceae bacterium]
MSRKAFYTALSAIILLAACAPLFTVNCIGGHDITYHLLRIEALKEGILAGRPFLRINLLFLGGTGYASSLFYPDLLLYIPALLRVSGLGIDLSFHIFIAVCIVLGYVSCFLSVRYISESDMAAAAAAIIFTLCQYHLDDIYVRSAVGEYTAAIFVPLVIAGLYDLVSKGFARPWILMLGMTGVLLCHTITAVVCTVLCIAMVLVYGRQLAAEPKIFLKLALAALTTLALTAFYWLPVVEMLSGGGFGRDFTFDLGYESVKLWEVFYNRTGRMGIAIFLFLLIRLVINKSLRFADICMICGLLLTLFSTSLIPWERLQEVLGFMQFPWRVYVVAGPLLAAAGGIYASILVSEAGADSGAGMASWERLVLIITTGIMLCSEICVLQRNDQPYYSYSNDYFAYAPYTAEIIGGEWLPAAAGDREALIAGADVAVLDNGSKLKAERYKNEIRVSSVPDTAEYVDVPFVYYKGYAATDTDSGSVLDVSAEGMNGCVRVYTDGARNIRVYYKGTLIQHISDVVSIVCIIALAAYSVMRIRRERTVAEED